MITLRDFKKLFTAKPCDFTLTVYSQNGKLKKIYDSMVDFFDDDFCDLFVVEWFSILGHDILIHLACEV